jgi:hypothetical protein
MAHERRTLTKVVQDSIDRGATTVEEIHKSIAEFPLKILEGNARFRAPAKEVRLVQDHTIGAIYDLIRKVNEEVGSLASDLLSEPARRAAKRPAKRPASRKHRVARHAMS